MQAWPEDAPAPRLCHLVKWPDFKGYGFNLRCARTNPSQIVGEVDEDSPAHLGGLKEGDRIVEVNGVNVNNENHYQVVERIKLNPNEVRLLVLDREADEWYQERDSVVEPPRSSQSNVIHIKTPADRPRAEHQDSLDQEEAGEHLELKSKEATPPVGPKSPPMSPDSGKGDDETACKGELVIEAEINHRSEPDRPIEPDSLSSAHQSLGSISGSESGTKSHKPEEKLALTLDSGQSSSSRSDSQSSSSSSESIADSLDDVKSAHRLVKDELEKTLLEQQAKQVDPDQHQHSGDNTKTGASPELPNDSDDTPADATEPIVTSDNGNSEYSDAGQAPQVQTINNNNNNNNLNSINAASNEKPANSGNRNGSNSNNNYYGLNLNMTASEMRELLARRKKFDAKKAQMNIRQKYEMIQRM